MTRPDDKLLLDMLQAARRVQGYLHGIDRERFGSDGLLQDGVVRRLEVLGEAAARVSPAFRSAHPEIPWPAMVGMRNRLVHEYFRVDLDVVWRVVKDELPGLAALLDPLVPPEVEG